MVIQNTCPNLSNIVHTDFELGRVIQTVGSADPGITEVSNYGLSSQVNTERDSEGRTAHSHREKDRRARHSELESQRHVALPQSTCT